MHVVVEPNDFLDPIVSETLLILRIYIYLIISYPTCATDQSQAIKLFFIYLFY